MGFLSRGFDRSVAQTLSQLREEASAAASASAADGAGAATGGGRQQRLATLPACVRRYLERTGAPDLPQYK